MNKVLLFLLCFAVPAFAQDSQPVPASGLTEQPAMYFGIEMCGKKTIWVLTTEGHFFRFDDEHHPDDVQAFLKSLDQIKGDVKSYPCPTAV